MIDSKSYADRYKKGKLPRPVSTPMTKKDDAFWRRYAQHLWGKYVAGECFLGYNGSIHGRSISELRLYGRGAQPVSKYQNLLDPLDPKTNDRIYNISWEQVKIVPNLRTGIKEQILAINLEPDIEAIDESSQFEREKRVNRMKLATKPQVQQFMAQAGVPVEEELPPGIENAIDVETLDRLGGLRLAAEIEVNDLVDKTISRSGWDVVFNQVADDILDGHVVAAHARRVPGGDIALEYVDIEKLIVPVSKYQDFRDAHFMGFWQRVSISELRERGVPENKLAQIATECRMKGPHWNDVGGWTNQAEREQYFAKNGYYPYEEVRVPLVTFYILMGDADVYVSGIHHKSGNEIYDPVDKSAELSPKDIKRGKKLVREVSQKLFKVCWIAGTDHLIEAGENKDNVFDEDGTPMMPLFVVQGDGPSPIAKGISIIDDIHLAIYKKRHLLAKMPPGPRIKINKSMLRNTVTFGDQKMSFSEIIHKYPATGVLIYEDHLDYSDPNLTGVKDPIGTMESGIVEDLTILNQEILTKFDELRTVLGVNALMDGSSQQPDMLKGVMEGLMASAQTINRPYARLAMMFYRRIVDYIGHYWQGADVYEDIERYSKEVIDNLSKRKFRFETRFGLSEQDKEVLLQALAVSREKGAIEEDAFLVIWNYIKRGDMAKAQLYMVKAVKEARKRQEQAQMQAIQAQNQGAMGAAQMKEDGQNQRQAMEHQHEREMVPLETNEEIRKLRATKSLDNGSGRPGS